MIIRIAELHDIPQIQLVRNSVKENTLSDPGLVTDADCATFITTKGKGWVCEINGKIVGFAIADLEGNNIWALFVLPEFEKKGIGRQLHNIMLDWYFAHTTANVWLSTSPGTRAAAFYKKAGWKETGIYGKSEIKFEMIYHDWTSMRTS